MTAFRCPSCGGHTRVVDSRPTGDRAFPVRRVRQCGACARRFDTHEVVARRDSAEALRTVRLAVSALRKALAALGETPAPKRGNRVEWTPEMEAALLRLRGEGATYLDCAVAIGVDEKIIARHCHRLGVNGRANRGRTPARQVIAEESTECPT